MAALPRRLAHRNVQPAITQPISPLQTGAVAQDELFGRQVTLTPATCGYYDGIATSPVTCDTKTGYECGFLPDSTAPNFGCCSTRSGGTTCELGYVSTCVENGDRNNFFSGGGILVDADNKRFLCGTDIPYCSTLVLYGSGTSYYSYRCQSGSGTTVTAYMTADTTVTSSSSSSSSSSTVSQDNSSSSASVEPTSKTISSVAQPSTAAPPSAGMSQGSKVGIGVGVGIGALVLLIAVIVFFVWKRWSGKRRAAHPSPGYQYQSAPHVQEMDGGSWYAQHHDTAPGHQGHDHYSARFADCPSKMYASELGEREPAELSGVNR